MKYLFTLHFFIFLLTINLSCAAGQTKIQGKIINGRYQAPNELYSFNIPKVLQGAPIQEDNSSDLFMISMQDDFGHLLRIETITFMTDDDRKGKETNILTDIFNAVIQIIRKQFPSTTILEEKLDNIDNIGPVCMAFIEIPEGSTLIDQKNKKRADSRRAYLISFCDNYLVIMSTQESPLVSLVKRYDQAQRMDDHNTLYDQLIQTRLSYRMIKNL